MEHRTRPAKRTQKQIGIVTCWVGKQGIKIYFVQKILKNCAKLHIRRTSLFFPGLKFAIMEAGSLGADFSPENAFGK
jgi:hypothetical protein